MSDDREQRELLKALGVGDPAAALTKATGLGRGRSATQAAVEDSIDMLLGGLGLGPDTKANRAGATAAAALPLVGGVKKIALAAKSTPVTRIVDRGLPVHSDKAETWFVVGHPDDAAVARLNNMYKSGKGDVHRGFLPSEMVDLSDDMSDEFGNPIAKVLTESFKKGFRAK